MGETSTVRLAKAEKYEYTLVIILNASPCKGGIGVHFSDKRERFALRLEGFGREYKQEDEGEEGAEEGMKRMCNPCTFLPNIGQKIGSI